MKKIFNVLMISLLSLSLVACTSEATNTNGNETTKDSVETTINNTSSEKEKDASTVSQEYKVRLYFPTEEYVVNGNEETKMGTEEVTIEGTPDTIPNLVMEHLTTGPKQENLENAVFPEQIKSVTIADGIVTVDLVGTELHGSSLDEELFINEIVNSLLSIDDVKGISFTVDGEKVESLMGHYEATDIFTKGV